MVRLLHLPLRTGAALHRALAHRMSDLPPWLLRSITWDQGTEMARHTEITADLGVPIYFCDPHAPWQRGSNENTNGLLRQYFPKRTDLNVYGPEHLRAVEDELNARPRLVLADHTASAPARPALPERRRPPAHRPAAGSPAVRPTRPLPRSPTAYESTRGRTGAARGSPPDSPRPGSSGAAATTRPPLPPSRTACADPLRSSPDLALHCDATPQPPRPRPATGSRSGRPTSGEAGLSSAIPLDGDGRDAGRSTVNPERGDRCEASDPDHHLGDHGCRPDLLPALNKSV